MKRGISSMNIIVCKDYKELSAKAAGIVADQIKSNPNSILGLATGSTPLGLYDNLVEMYSRGEISFENITSFNLDEYYPLSAENEQSYRYFMNKNLFSRININTENTFVPNGEAEDPSKECSEYDKKILAYGGIDLQILGIGQNGHIGFNEPDDILIPGTHLTGLTKSTIDANSRFFDRIEDVPTRALTMGIGSIMKARKIIILANGASKRDVITNLLAGGITTQIPASMLLTHPDVTLICDSEAYPGMSLGVDIGGTNIKFGVLDHEDNLIHTDSIPTPKDADDRGIIKVITKKCLEIIGQFPINGIGVGSPGDVNVLKGVVTASNIPFKNSPIISYMQEDIDIPIYLENDACCATIAEAHAGIAAKNMVFVALGTGIGSGIAIDGKIYRGSNGYSGEVGHSIIDPNGIKCACGLTGCWEQYASVTALIRQTQDAANKNPDSILSEVIKNNGSINGKTVFEAMDKGCPVAKAVFDQYITYLSIGIQNVIAYFDPDTVILGGAISKEGDKLLLPLREKVVTNATLKISTLGSDAGSIGAALLCKLNR